MLYQLIVLILGLSLAVSAAIQAKKISSKIVRRKQVVDISALPYQVSLQLNDWHTCGGAIIHPSWIVTAAHCVKQGTAANYSVRAGSHVHYFGGELVQASKIIVHPLYDVKAPNKCDVALVKLEIPLKLNQNIQTIPISNSEPIEGDLLLVSGWGGIKEQGHYTKDLQVTIIPVVSRRRCKKAYEVPSLISEFIFCAGLGEGKRDACKADSGGPAVFNNKLVGIWFWGKGCAQLKYPGVYINLAHFKHWIESQIS